MATLKGQNLRIYTVDGQQTKVFGMATNCTITLNGNTENESHKDIVDMASAPIITSKSWQVQVDSLNVNDVNGMLTAIKAGTKFKLMWDESNTTDNQTPVKATFARVGEAFLTDVVFSFNDRTTSTKNLQFTGTGPLATAPNNLTLSPAGGSITKGQYVRLFLGSDNTAEPSKVIGAAKDLSFHVSVSVENITTKDTVSDWVINEPTELTYDITSSAFVRSGETITSTVQAQALADIETIYTASSPVRYIIANVDGANNRTIGTDIVTGSVIITSLSINGPNRQVATYQMTLTGYGPYTVES